MAAWVKKITVAAESGVAPEMSVSPLAGGKVATTGSAVGGVFGRDSSGVE